ncbi:MAG TPA: FadR/GntR family transcriptional regulator [Bryobacteraceae bacterium]|nr:FadR/GntR family transcriptional regulator [Bryobacteraceae bacterium]
MSRQAQPLVVTPAAERRSPAISTLKPLSRITLAEQVVTQLTEMFARENWQPGDRLPAEPQLCRSLNVGRSTLREALKTLTFLGLLRVRPGEGTFIAADASRMLDRIVASGLLRTRNSLSDLCETRLILETEIVALAAKRVLPEDLERLRQLDTAMQNGSQLATGEFVELDVGFHMSLAAAAKNEVLTQLLSTIRGLLQDWIVKSQRLTEARGLANSGHPKILEAIAGRKPGAARRAMAEHLEASFLLLLQASGTES